MCALDDVLYLFGGVGAAGTESILDVCNELWTFDTRELTWQQVERQGVWPSPRRCVGFMADDDRLTMWGGSGVTGTPARYTFLNDWWVFDTKAAVWSLLRDTDDHRNSPPVSTTVAYPCPRYTPVLARMGSTTFLFGGYTEDRLGKRKLNDVWLHEQGTWTELPRTGRSGYGPEAQWPGERYGCMSASTGREVFVFGGFSDDGDHNDLWVFNLQDKRWHLVIPDAEGERSAPAARYCAAFAYHRDQLFLFGGRSRRHPKNGFNDLWCCDLRDMRWRQVHGNRTPHVYAADAAFPGYHAKTAHALSRGALYIWGGEGEHGHVSDFWRLHADTARWEMIQGARPDDPSFW